MNEAPRVLIVSDDDDVTGPLAGELRRAGYRVGVRGGADGADELEGAPPDVLILDRDMPQELRRRIAALLEPHSGDRSFPLLLLGRVGGEGAGAAGPVPAGWHEDAWFTMSRHPGPDETLRSIVALRRLAFYRGYRGLVHDLSQPVTSIHALARAIAGATRPGDPAHEHVQRLVGESERLLSCLEQFQRTRVAGDGRR